MSISLPTNKEEKRLRLIMLVKQDSLTVIQANKLFADYCRLYDKVQKKTSSVSPRDIKTRFDNIDL